MTLKETPKLLILLGKKNCMSTVLSSPGVPQGEQDTGRAWTSA